MPGENNIEVIKEKVPPEEPPHSQEEHKNRLSWPQKTVIATFAAFTTLGTFIGYMNAIEGGSDESPNATPTASNDIDIPPSEKTTLTPSKTPEASPSQNPTDTQSPMPSPSAEIEQTATPTPSQEHESPTLVPAESEAPKNYTIEFLPPQDPDNPAQATVTEEEAREIIENYLSILPPKYPLTINVSLGGGSYHYPTLDEIKIDLASANFSLDFAYEYAQKIDEYIKANPQLAEKRAAVLNDPRVGSQIPNFDQIFAQNYETALSMYQAGNPIGLEEFKIITSHAANTEWISSNGNDPFGVALEYARIAQITQRYEIDETEFTTAEEYLASAEIQKLKNTPLWNTIISQLETDDELESYFAVANNMLDGDKSGKNYNDALKIIARAVTSEGILENNSAILETLEGQDVETMKMTLQIRLERVQEEDIAHKIASYINLRLNDKLLTESITINDLIGAYNRKQPPVPA